MGHQVFISGDADIGWDGTFKAANQPAGVYIWTFIGTTIDDKTYNLQGEITLIR